eukprot:ANDGO_04633.mRNA.1 Very-long-chain 3-oxoacyl-CoA reductase 1
MGIVYLLQFSFSLALTLSIWGLIALILPVFAELLMSPYGFSLTLLPMLVPLVLGTVFLFSVAVHYTQLFIVNFLSSGKLVKKYRCEWALVTGASSGLGKAIAFDLASQGANVVLVALDNELLHSTCAELTALYPNRQFMKIGVNFGDFEHHSYEQVILEQTRDLRINVVFLNAGYIVLKGFTKAPIDTWMRNLECNVLSGVRLSHAFMSRMRANNTRGFVCFTSSAAAMFPAPSQVLYSSGKAFLQNFAQSLAIEAGQYGIDVQVLLPGPMAGTSNFYTQNEAGKVPKLDAFKFFLAIATTPNVVARQACRAAGWVTMLDTGAFTIFMRMFVRLVDWNAACYVMKKGLPLSGDFKNNKDFC